MARQIEIAAHLRLSARHVRNLIAAGVFRKGATLDEAAKGYSAKKAAARAITRQGLLHPGSLDELVIGWGDLDAPNVELTPDDVAGLDAALAELDLSDLE